MTQLYAPVWQRQSRKQKTTQEATQTGNTKFIQPSRSLAVQTFLHSVVYFHLMLPPNWYACVTSQIIEGLRNIAERDNGEEKQKYLKVTQNVHFELFSLERDRTE